MPSSAIAALVDAGDARRLSRVCQLSIAAARLAVRESGVDAARGLGLVVGTEFGDVASTHLFADGFLERGPAGLSPLLFPNTVMNTMAATTAIAVGARELALTLNAPTVAGELAVARAAAAVASGQVPAILAGGVDEIDAVVERQLPALGFAGDRLGEGATFLVLEAQTSRRREARASRPCRGRDVAHAAARPWGVGRGGDSAHHVSRAGRRRVAHLARVQLGERDRRRSGRHGDVGRAGPTRPGGGLARLLGRPAASRARVAAAHDRALGIAAGGDGVGDGDDACLAAARSRARPRARRHPRRPGGGRSVTPLLLIPACDERATVGAVVAGARRHGDVLVVDDGSTDGTGAIAQAAGAEVLRHARRLGKAQALRTGIVAAARAREHVIPDADGTDPDDVPARSRRLRARSSSGRLGDAAACDRATEPSGWMLLRCWAAAAIHEKQAGFRLYRSPC